jgi:hypothetical protein
MAMDLSHWDFVENFSGYEAAALILGNDPTDDWIDQSRVSTIVRRMEWHYDIALEKLEFELKNRFLKPPNDGCDERISLYSAAMGRLYFRQFKYREELSYDEWLLTTGDISFGAQEFSRTSINSWLSGIGMRSIYPFIQKASKLDTPAVAPDTRPSQAATTITRWPWGNHHTLALGHLEAAANHWWKPHDPADTAKAPTNEKISAWLQKERGLSQKMADSIASILRPDDLSTGPRK